MRGGGLQSPALFITVKGSDPALTMASLASFAMDSCQQRRAARGSAKGALVPDTAMRQCVSTPSPLVFISSCAYQLRHVAGFRGRGAVAVGVQDHLQHIISCHHQAAIPSTSPAFRRPISFASSEWPALAPLACLPGRSCEE